MTSAVPTSATSGLTLIWDASALHHAIKADKIDVLADMAGFQSGTPRRNLTTAAVRDEISHHHLPVSGLHWLETVHVDGLDELAALVDWMGRVSGQKSNQGEATVLAWAEVHDAVAVIDDRDAVRVGRAGGLEVWGSLRVTADPSETVGPPPTSPPPSWTHSSARVCATPAPQGASWTGPKRTA